MSDFKSLLHIVFLFRNAILRALRKTNCAGPVDSAGFEQLGPGMLFNDVMHLIPKHSSVRIRIA